MLPLALLLTLCLAWKEKPASDTCMSWCKFDDGVGKHIDACTHPFKMLQCQGCERCVARRAAKDAAATHAAVRCEQNATATEVVLRAELDELKVELQAAKAQAKAADAAKTAAEAAAAKAATKRETEMRSLRAAARVATTERDAQATAARLRADVLVRLRWQQPAAYAILMLNTAPNASLRSAVGSASRAAELVARRPWFRQVGPPSLEALLGDRGGVHGIGKDRLKTIEAWALGYVPGGSAKPTK